VEPSPLGPGGRIIFVSATMHYTGMVFQTHVTVAKAGVDALSNNIALEFGPLGITSNIISPGPIANTEVGDRIRSCIINFVLTGVHYVGRRASYA
jgi:2,4-dienoyl-CoA reductase [(3E)-enoyl-CoA-producing], peroxisomal